MSTEFTKWLRGRSDEQLRELVTLRPELITPVPAHVEGLAGRASSPSAVGRVLDRLDRFTFAVVETLAVLPSPVSYRPLRAGVARALSGPADSAFEARFRQTVDRLRTLALVYGPDRALTPAPGVREVLDGPAGLGPPAREAFRHYHRERLAELVGDLGGGGDTAEALGALLADPEVVARLVGEVSPQARSALDELAWGPASGRVANARREVRAATARSPIEQLLARALLCATGEESVVLPREVGLFLRGGRIHRELSPVPPPLAGTERTRDLTDRTAAGQAFAFTRAVEELCERWGAEPPGVLRGGGLAVRDLKRAAALLDLPEWAAGLVIEVAHAAGLVAASGAVDGDWMPTPVYDGWRVRATEERWVVLASTWLATDRVPGVIGDRDERDRLLNALHPDLRRAAAPEVRAAVLGVLATAGDAATAPLAPTLDSVRERLAWEQPRRRGPHRDRLVEFTLREAEQIGVTGLGALARHGRALLPARAGDDAAGRTESGTGAGPGSGAGTGAGTAAGLLAPLLPVPLDHVLLQADLTAVAPGPLTGELSRWLALAADVESTGGATVYRFGEHSIRRALDAGQGADEMLAMLERHSTTPVPQPLGYLVADVARRHGRMRVGTAGSYVRCDDPSALDEVMADRRAAPLRLRRLAPTVIASKTARSALVDSLRAMGYAPVAESLEGDVIITRLDVRRTEGPPQLRAPAVSGGLDAEVITAAVRAVRAGDAAHRARRKPAAAPDGQVPRSPATATIGALREAIRQGSQVWIGYLDSQGNATSRILEPARMEGGYLTAYDETRAAVHRFALHRITGVADVQP
ncbi:helicase-associated domain-containing protein [Planomonospora sp. ID82291]|uniref:helicase-associated domain-containing protein n=1 Tax=Planomonospora sp. ID82291 TaxID=2738136 RepID=UPI0018C3A91B|nr:helicase-associated domain-containing protein [Planomonospora sp. ID82291]MBG0814755.1 helicase-associated domain-containing protein [Planomonospora sp. ID82291]